MNGIIHNSTHKDSDSPTFRMTEDKMFIGIFNYIEHLFGTIKPKKLFFMAIDVGFRFSGFPVSLIFAIHYVTNEICLNRV